MLRLYCFLVFLFLSVMARSQELEIRPQADSSVKKDYSQYPYWIEMMEDSLANYYEVQKAFEAFWQGKQVPVGEQNELRPIHDPADQDLSPINSKYVAEVKSYRAWVRYYADLHDENGILFPPSRIIEEWERQMKEREKP